MGMQNSHVDVTGSNVHVTPDGGFGRGVPSPKPVATGELSGEIS